MKFEYWLKDRAFEERLPSKSTDLLFVNWHSFDFSTFRLLRDVSSSLRLPSGENVTSVPVFYTRLLVSSIRIILTLR